MKTKIFSIVLVFAIILTAFVAVSASSFVDVPDDAYYAEAAERMAERGILSGYGDGNYYGSDTVTRAQIAALVSKMLGDADKAATMAGPTQFIDVPETNWSAGYVNYAVANGIINGDGDGNFRPDDSVKYEEVIKVIVCVLGLDNGIKINPADWSKEYIEAAEKAGLTANLIGKKGEPMLRSDIAVICDAAMLVLDSKTEETTSEKPSSPSKPTSTTENSEVTTETPAEITAGPEETVEAPEVTTKSEPNTDNKDKVTIVTTAATTEHTISPPPPRRDNETDEL